ncbi:hypothetical protein XvhCFBP2543_09440 [Xanthomonas vasicola]|nr:hypothetical protein NX04_20920 [Xanthomonas vasicola]KGR45667.1 hypothetical protein NX05_06605 [Xanthomonas vasicola]KGR58581.1 hypothetical protein NX79_18380 [Xanthomonas vasicola]PPV02945.1 hypothetical protein XvhCFBP2543_09440 [Xanthomonas vasicola]
MLDQNELIHPHAAVAPGYLANHAARVFSRLFDAELRPRGVSAGTDRPDHAAVLERPDVAA